MIVFVSELPEVRVYLTYLENCGPIAASPMAIADGLGVGYDPGSARR